MTDDPFIAATLIMLAAVLLGLGIGYVLAWVLIGHEPLLPKNCTCDRSRYTRRNP